MKVLVANKFHYVKGGAERYYFELARILQRKGHAVVPFAMEHEKNEPSEHSRFFVSRVSFEEDSGSRLAKAARVIYSTEARRKIEDLVTTERPDIAHLHNIAHQLSPSILYGLKRRGVPVVQTLHDYKIVCPNYQMFVEGETCERCGAWKYYPAIFHRCMHGSTPFSLVVCVEAYVHQLLGTYGRLVDLFIAPSRQLLERVVAHGVDREKIVHLPYAIELDEYAPRYDSEDYAVYLGRLSIGKGLETLVRAAERARDVEIRILGDGPMADDLKREVESRSLGNVVFLGYRSGEELTSIVAGARFVVVPSECFENSPLTVYEASALGKPVVGSRMGGIPELVLDGETGLLFEPRSDAELADRMSSLWSDPARASAMGRAARERAEREFAPDRHYEAIMRIYERVMQ